DTLMPPRKEHLWISLICTISPRPPTPWQRSSPTPTSQMHVDKGSKAHKQTRLLTAMWQKDSPYQFAVPCLPHRSLASSEHSWGLIWTCAIPRYGNQQTEPLATAPLL